MEFFFYLFCPEQYRAGFDFAPDRNEYEESARKADNLTAICDPIV
jgi:hypothetical protein